MSNIILKFSELTVLEACTNWRKTSELSRELFQQNKYKTIRVKYTKDRVNLIVQALRDKGLLVFRDYSVKLGVPAEYRATALGLEVMRV